MKTEKKKKMNNCPVEAENVDTSVVGKTKKPKPPKTTKAPTEVAEENPLKSFDSTFFQYFRDFTNEDDKIRIKASLQLLKQLTKAKEPEQRQKELSYTLKRLIRGCGAATNASRAGFFTALTALLKAFPAEEITIAQIFETIEKELHLGTIIKNKEDADAVVGKILTCGAILHSGRIVDINSESLEKITNILLESSRHRTYHTSMSIAFIIELMAAVSAEQFEQSIWPLLREEIIQPWPKQTLQTIHCVISIQEKYPSVINKKFLKSNFGGPELLNAESYQHLLRIFWKNSNTDILTHPAFEAFGVHIAKRAKLIEFWTDTVDPCLAKPTKLLEMETLKICTDIFAHVDHNQTNIAHLLSPNFIRMLVTGLKNMKTKKDEILKAFYDDFLEALIDCCLKIKDDEQKVEVIHRLILHPGIFNIEKFTTNRVVHQLIGFLGEQGVKAIYETFKKIFLNNISKNPEDEKETWLNFERQNAGYMLQHLVTHKAVQNAYQWRQEQLTFFMTCGIFYVNDGSAEICKKDAAGQLSKDFGDQMKNMFYSSLQSKLSALGEEKQILVSLVNVCNERMQKKHAAKFFRIKNFDSSIQKAWADMYAEISKNAQEGKKKKKNKKEQSENCDDNKLKLVFHILLLHMGLQLFREPEMAVSAIVDLQKCMDRTDPVNRKTKPTIKLPSENADDLEEPEWIEVVIDLFLHLLSQNASVLRNIVNALFPHLCSNLNPTAMHQILAMLDMKDGLNPLSVKGEEDDEEEAEEEQDDAKEEAASSEDNSDDDDDEDEEDDAEEDINEVIDEEEGTATDKLRNAISLALTKSGATAPHDDDMDSIDLNDMTEEEGRKLDEALGAAFKAMKKPIGGNKRSKSQRFKVTTVMHFRIRVLDLIEIYIQNSPSLLMSIEIMLALFNMIEFCFEGELKPLESKVEKVLSKLTALRQFSSVADVNEENLVDFIRLIVEKKVPSRVFDISNRMRNKCIVFLVSNTKLICTENEDASPGTKVIALCTEYMEEFIQSRNPTINITLLSDLFKLRWDGVWQLAVPFIKKGIQLTTRTFRRIQIFEILAILYKNFELFKLNEDTTKRRLKTIERAIVGHLNLLATGDNVQYSAKEFQTILEVLLSAHRAHAKFEKSTTPLSSETTTALIQEIRRKIKLDSPQVYQRFCGVHRLQIIKNSETVQRKQVQQNGDGKTEIDSGNVKAETSSKSKKKSKLKRKLSDKDSQKEKSEAEPIQQNENENEETTSKSKEKVKRKRKGSQKQSSEADQSMNLQQNGDGKTEIDSADRIKEVSSKSKKTAKLKRKNSEKDSRKEKKQKKEERMKASSKGLNGGFTFTQSAPADVSDEAEHNCKEDSSE